MLKVRCYRLAPLLFGGNHILHSKNTRVSRDPEKGPMGPNSIPGQRWPRNRLNWQLMGSDWPSSGSNFALSWLISGSSLTRNGVWLHWLQWTLFRVTLTRVFLECSNLCPKYASETVFRAPNNNNNNILFLYSAFHNCSYINALYK